MNPIRTASLAFALFGAVAGAAHAQSAGPTRAEVKTQTLEAIRNGDIAGPGDSGESLRELFPSRYPAQVLPVGLARSTVKADLAAANRAGDVPEGDLQETPRDISPSRYPPEPVPMQATRAEVKGELKEAIRTGDIESVGDLAEPLNQLFPQRYPMQASAARR